MRLLKYGDPCPCCGQPIPDGMTIKTIVLMSWLAEGKPLLGLAKTAEMDMTQGLAWRSQYMARFERLD